MVLSYYINTMNYLRRVLCILCIVVLSGCGGDSSDQPVNNASVANPPVENQPGNNDAGSNNPTPSEQENPDTSSPEQPADSATSDANTSFESIDIIPTGSAAARLLSQATFGPSDNEIKELTGASLSEWINSQFDKPASLHSQHVEKLSMTYGDDALEGFMGYNTTTTAFWTHAVTAEDQLRQRVAFALSQILVVSNANDDLFEDFPEAVSSFQDILIQQSFGNYADLMLEITYSPTMGRYLTYLGNRKADPATGSVPDENYAREILQLFTIGLVALNMDGSVQTDNNNHPIELYDNSDITELAKVFTGLNYALGRDDEDPEEALAMPMVMNEQWHSTEQKSFLGLTIPESTDGTTSIRLAIEHIVNQPSVAPFISRQLIQRLVTSHPEPDYIARVATAFETGSHLLPNGTMIGEGRKGDLKATVAAILTDPDARFDMMSANVDLTTFGKVREPVLRLTHWARAFDLESVTPELLPALWQTASGNTLNQHPYKSSSVFNFFRPGYVAPNSFTGEAGLTMPELQILNASSSFGYINYISGFVAGFVQENPEDFARELAEDIDEPTLDVSQSGKSFLPDYSNEALLASEPARLVDHLASRLITGTLSNETRNKIIEAVSLLPFDAEENDIETSESRVQLVIIMLMTSADYLVQQ